MTFMLSVCSNTLTLESIFKYIRQKFIKNMLILKFHPRMKCLHVFFSFFHPCLSSRDEISSRQKRVNSKRHFTIDMDDCIPGRVSSWDEISRVNALSDCWSRDMLNFDFLVSPPYFGHDFSRKIFLILYIINAPSFIIWLPFLF